MRPKFMGANASMDGVVETWQEEILLVRDRSGDKLELVKRERMKPASVGVVFLIRIRRRHPLGALEEFHHETLDAATETLNRESSK